MENVGEFQVCFLGDENVLTLGWGHTCMLQDDQTPSFLYPLKEAAQ